MPSDAPQSPGESDEVLIELVAEALERLDSEGPAALEAMCKQHPERAAALRERVERLRRAGLAVTGDGGLPERLGAFSLRAPIGGGGMGLVVRAVQEGLARPVALKLIRPELLHLPGARDRFRREIAAVSRLQHVGIVPVFAGGEEGGIPYFAMELVLGASLEEVLVVLAGRDPRTLSGADLRAAVLEVQGRHASEECSAESDVPCDPRSETPSSAESASKFYAGNWSVVCLRIARQIADALQHAHERGVLHRDVKPSNVLLTPEGRVLLIDFGLAAAEGSERLTASGIQLGSLAWMSPEQVRGEHDRLDARTDVYSLGATLAELLTLSSPFAGASADATRKSILEGRPVPLRKLNPAVPRDAETVCCVALDRDRERRYSSAAAFSEDLGRVLEHRPILARRPGILRRASRWAQRRPAAAVAAILSTLLLVAGPIGWELNRMRTIDQLRAARDRSDRQFESALGAIGQVLRGMAVDEMEDVPRMQRAQLLAIDRALELFPSLEIDRADDPLVIEEGAALEASRGDVLRDLGRSEEAFAAFKRSVEKRRRWLAQSPGTAREVVLASALTRAGKTLDAMSRHSEALPYLTESVDILRRAVTAEPAVPSIQLDLAVALANLGRAHFSLGALETCEALWLEAQKVASAVRAKTPGDANAIWTEGRTFTDLGDLAEERKKFEDRSALAASALADYRAAAAAQPERRFFNFDVSTGLFSLGRAEMERKRFVEADAALDEALSVVDALLREFPDSARYRRRRIEILDNFALCAGFQEQHARAFGLFEASLAEKERLCDQEPDRCDLAFEAASTLLNLANSLAQRVERLKDALALIDRAERRLAPCDRQVPVLPHVAQAHGSARYLRVLVLCLLDLPVEAATAIEEFEAKVDPGALPLRRAADLWNEWILALRRAQPELAQREPQESKGRRRMFALLQRAIAAGYDDVDELSSTASLDSFRQDPEFVALLAGIRK